MGAARVRDLFKQAREKAPCIVFIDELDALGKARGMGAMGGHDEREQTLQQLLVEMDGFDPRAGVIIMAATNRPEILDPALLRAGRFDRQVLVDKPDLNGRIAILEVHAKRITLGDDVDLKVLAQRTPGLSGADLENILNEGALLAARANRDEVTMADLEEAVDRIVGGLGKEEPGHQRGGEKAGGLSRDRPRPGGLLHPQGRQGAQDIHHPPGHRRPGLHRAAPHRRPLPHEPERAGGQGGRDAGRPGGRAHRLRRGEHRRGQ